MPPKNDADRRYAILALRIVSEFGAAIAVPVVLATAAGRRLDGMYGTEPAFLIAGFALAAAVTAVYVVKRARSYGKEYDALNAAAKKGRPEKKK